MYKKFHRCEAEHPGSWTTMQRPAGHISLAFPFLGYIFAICRGVESGAPPKYFIKFNHFHLIIF